MPAPCKQNRALSKACFQGLRSISNASIIYWITFPSPKNVSTMCACTLRSWTTSKNNSLVIAISSSECNACRIVGNYTQNVTRAQWTQCGLAFDSLLLLDSLTPPIRYGSQEAVIKTYQSAQDEWLLNMPAMRPDFWQVLVCEATLIVHFQGGEMRDLISVVEILLHCDSEGARAACQYRYLINRFKTF